MESFLHLSFEGTSLFWSCRSRIIAPDVISGSRRNFFLHHCSTFRAWVRFKHFVNRLDLCLNGTTLGAGIFIEGHTQFTPLNGIIFAVWASSSLPPGMQNGTISGWAPNTWLS